MCQVLDLLLVNGIVKVLPYGAYDLESDPINQ